MGASDYPVVFMGFDAVTKAKDIAEDVHRGVKRKFSDDPYIVHPQRIAAKLRSKFPNDWPLEAAAWLHDTVEDEPFVTPDYLKVQGMPDCVIDLVMHVTRRDDESYSDFIHRIGTSGEKNAIRLKIADIEDNLRDLKKSSLRDKYELARTILERYLVTT